MDEPISPHQQAAQSQPHDEHGHFAPKPPLPKESYTHYDKKQDDLLDVHVGNPLRKITLLLEEIKKQKAFSFTLKGSLGIMGVVLTLSVFGILGGGKLLCDRGIQTQIGTLKTLRVAEVEPRKIPLLDSLISLISPISPTTHPRTVLIKNDGTIINIPFSKALYLPPYENSPVLMTGNYDACSQTLKVVDTAGVEVYSR